MKRRWTCAALAMSGACGIYLLAGATAQEAGRRAPSRYAARSQATRSASANASPSPPDSPAPVAAQAFDGKLVAVYVRGAQQAKLVEQARFAELKGRTFLIGKEVPGTLSFALGTDAYVAWDAVDAFYVFDNVEQYEAALQKALQGVGDSMGTVLEEVFSGGQEAEDADVSPVSKPQPAPQDETSLGLPVRAPLNRRSAPGTEHVIRDPNDPNRRYIERTARDSDGHEVVVYEEVSASSGTLAGPGLPRSSSPVLLPSESPPSTHAPDEVQLKPTEAKQEPMLPYPVSPR